MGFITKSTCCVLIVVALTRAQQTTNCTDGTFFDHGTNNCESCEEWCRFTIKGSADECRRLCPSTYKAMKALQDRQELIEDMSPTGDPSVGKTPDTSNNNTWNTIAPSVFTSITGALVIAVAIAVFVLVKRSMQNRHAERQRGPPPLPVVGYTAIAMNETAVNEERDITQAVRGSEGSAEASQTSRLLLPEPAREEGAYGQETRSGHQGPQVLAPTGSLLPVQTSSVRPSYAVYTLPTLHMPVAASQV